MPPIKEALACGDTGLLREEGGGGERRMPK